MSFIMHSGNKGGGTRFHREHLISPSVVGSGNANTGGENSMTNRFMVSVAALALLAGTGMANAQGMGKESGGATGGGAMQHSSPSDTSSGASKSESGASKSEKSESSESSKGGMQSSQSEQRQPGAMKNDRAEDNVKGGSTSQRAEDRAKGAEKGTETNQRAQENTKDSTKSGRDNMKAEGRQDRNAPNAAENNRMEKSGTNAAESKSTTERTQTTGQAGAGAKLTSDQRTKITSVIHNQHVQSVDRVDFALSVGTRVPRDRVHVQTLPSEVVSIYPEWRGYDFIVVHDKIVIIDPNTYEIVEVIES
jgi:hypothetical protein